MVSYDVTLDHIPFPFLIHISSSNFISTALATVAGRHGFICLTQDLWAGCKRALFGAHRCWTKITCSAPQRWSAGRVLCVGHSQCLGEPVVSNQESQRFRVAVRNAQWAASETWQAPLPLRMSRRRAQRALTGQGRQGIVGFPGQGFRSFAAVPLLHQGRHRQIEIDHISIPVHSPP